MTLEEILKLVKLKYKDAYIENNKFINGVKIADCPILNELSYIVLKDNKIYFNYFDNSLNYRIDNNLFELKHYLGLEITEQDIIDYCLRVSFYYDEDKAYLIYGNEKIEDCYVLHISNLCLSIFNKNQGGMIFFNGKGKEYRLYQIIKNLIED